MINQQQWLKARKNLLEQVKSQVEVRLGPPSKSLRQYAKKLDKEFKGAWRECSETEIRKNLSLAHLVLSADFHAYAQSQRAHIRLLRDYVERENVIVLLECLPASADNLTEEFLSGRLSEKRFLEAIDWEGVWGFPWENYRPLLELARDRGMTVRGLNQPRLNALKERDLWMAKRVRQIAQANPDALIYVVVGEWHLAENHLPKLISKGRSPRDVMTFFQDAESLYFKLARRNREGHVDFLKASGNRYCFMVSPPWMKWQSYLMYLEQAYDRELQEDPNVDYTDHVAALIGLLENDLKIKTSRAHLQVFGPSSTRPMARLKASLPKRFLTALVYHLEHDLSFYIPDKQWLYLSRATINHASGLAGQFVHAHLCGRRKILWAMPEHFLALIWVEAIGFFFSKWINPKRKAETLDSIRLQLKAFDPEAQGRKALLLALDHRLSEVVFTQTGRLRRPQYKAREISAYLDASRIVGGMLGERLYQKVRSGSVPLRQLMSYLKIDVEGAKFKSQYWRIIRELG